MWNVEYRKDGRQNLAPRTTETGLNVTKIARAVFIGWELAAGRCGEGAGG